MAALVGGVLVLPGQSAVAGCSQTGQVWNCSTSGQVINANPQALIQPTGPAWQVNVGTGTADTYRDTGNFQSTGSNKANWNLGVLEIFNTNESGTVTVGSSSKLAGQEADGIRFYDTTNGTPTITFNVYGQVLGGTKAWTVSPALAEPGDGIHVGRSSVNFVDPEFTMGSFILNVGSASETDALVEGGDNGVYIAQGISNLAAVTNYGAIIGVGNRSPTNWGEGVHISRVAKGQGDTFQISGAASVLNYGDIEGHAAGGIAGGDADGPGSGVNVSANGDILIGNYSSNESGTITGIDGVVAYGGGSNAITVSNTGHIEGTYGNGITVSHGGVGSITNHSFHSVIGSGGVDSSGVDAEDFHQVIFDNEGGLTAGLTGSGAYIANVDGVGESGDAVHVNNTNGGLIAGYTGGLVISNVTGATSEGEANNVLIENQAQYIGDGEYATGGLIVGAHIDGYGTSNGITVSHVFAASGSESAADSGSVTIDNRDTFRTVVDLSTVTDASVYTIGEGDTASGLLGAFDPPGVVNSGIFGGADGISLSDIGGAATIYNQDGSLYGWLGNGITMSEVGGNIAIYNGTTGGGDGGWLHGNESGVSITGFGGNIDIENGVGQIDGPAGNAIYIADATSAGQHITIGNGNSYGITSQYGSGIYIDANAAVTVTNGDSNESGFGYIAGGTTGVLVEGGDTYDIAVSNSGHIQGGDGSGIQISHGAVGSITNHSFQSVIGSGGVDSSGVDAENFHQVIFDNSGGLTAGITGTGATIAYISGVGESGDAVSVNNSEGGLLAGYTGGLSIQNVTGNSSESEANNVYVDNRAVWISGDSYSAGGLIIGLDGAGVSISNVAAGSIGSESDLTSGSVTIDNQDTRHTSIDFGSIADASVYHAGDPASGLLGTFVDSQGDGSESVSTGIYGSQAIYLSEVGGGFTLNNQDGLVVGTDADGVHIDTIGGNVAINNGRSWAHGDGGLIVGATGADAIDVENFYKNVTVDNIHGTISGSNNGVEVINALGVGQTVSVENESGAIAADGLAGVGVNLSVNDTSVVAIDNSRAGHHHSEGGVISGGLYGVAVMGGALVDIDNTHGTIYATESGTGAGVVLTDVGRVSIGNAGGSIYDSFAESEGINIYGVSEGADIDNAASWHGGGGYIAGTYRGIAGAEIAGGVTVENADGVVVGSEGDGIRFAIVHSSNEAGYAVAIDNSSTWGHDGGIIAGEDNGVVINTVGSTYAAGNNIVAIDNSGYVSSEHDHAGGLIASSLGDGVAVFNAESDVQIYNAYTRANGSLNIGESAVGAAAAGLLSPLAEAGDDFLSPGSTGIWGLGGSGVYGNNIAGGVYVDNRQGQIVGLGDDRAAVELNGVGGGLTPGESGIAVDIDNSNAALASSEDGIGDFSRYSLLSGGDYGVKLSSISNGDVVFNNDFGITYGDEMAFALNGLTEGDVLITNSAGVMEGHNGSSTLFPTRDSYGAITIANVDGHVQIRNASESGGYGGDIIGVDSASAIYLAGGIKSAEIYNTASYYSESSDQTQGGVIVGSGTEANPVIVLNTSTGESDTQNGVVLNSGLIGSTNIYGFSDPDITGRTTDVGPVMGFASLAYDYVVGGLTPDALSESGAFSEALGLLDNHNAGADGISAARDMAIASDTGATYVENAGGAIFGRVDLTGSNAGSEGDTIHNELWNLAGIWLTEGANYLGSESSIRNDGVIQTAFGSEGDLATSFDVTDFHNDGPAASGYLSMLDGVVGNVDTITGNFHGSETEEGGAHSYVALDAYLDVPASESGTPGADVLHVEGDVSGTTGLIIHNLNPNPIDMVNPDGIKVVQVDGESDSCGSIACQDGDPFYISSKSADYLEINGFGTVQQGLYAWYLTDPGESGHEYDLVTAALPTADQTPELMTAFANIFYNGVTDAVSEHLYGGSLDPDNTGGSGADVDGSGQPDRKPSGAVWGRISGAWSKQDTTVDTQLGPVDTGFNQNTYTLLGGVDMSPSADGNGLRFGAYGGYVTSSADFDAYAATGKYTGGVAGGYLAYTRDNFYVDTQFTADFVNLAFDAPLGTGVTGNVNGTTLGVMADAGKRYYAGASFLEPLASFAYANTTLGDMQSGSATISFSNGQSVRGGVGARVGVATTDASGVHVELSLLARLWDEFSGNNLVTVTDGTNTDTFADDTSGVFGEVSASATLLTPDRSTSLFASGGASFKADATTLNAKAGVRKSF